jgi:hypothetical protein
MAITVTDEMGAFDSIIAGIKPILQDEYDNGRIVGTDYANVLFGSINASLQMAFAKKAMDADIAIKGEQLSSATYSRTTILPKQGSVLDAEIALKNSQKSQFDKYGTVKKVEALSGIGAMAANAQAAPTPEFWTTYFSAVGQL